MTTIAVTWIATAAALGLALGYLAGYGHGWRAHGDTTPPFRLVDRAPARPVDWLALAQQPRRIASHACASIADTPLEYRARHLARARAPRALEMAT